MTQRDLPLSDPPETREQRLERLLSGDVGRHCTTAAKLFTEANAREAARLAAGQQTTTCQTGSPK